MLGLWVNNTAFYMSTVFQTVFPCLYSKNVPDLNIFPSPSLLTILPTTFMSLAPQTILNIAPRFFFLHKENLVLQLFVFKLSQWFPALLLVKEMESTRPCLLLGLPFFQPPLCLCSPRPCYATHPLSLSGVILLSSRLRLLWVPLPPLEFLQLPFLQITNPVSFLTFSPSLVTITGYTFMLSKLLVIFHPCL